MKTLSFASYIGKGPNYREPQAVNLKHCRDKIEMGLEVCAHEMGGGENGINLSQWKEIILKKVDSRIALLKSRDRNPISTKKCNPVLKRPDVKEYLDFLHKHFVLVPIDKAANNISIICKRFYVQVILKEIGVLDIGNLTYNSADRDREEIISENCQYTAKLGYDVSDKEKVYLLFISGLGTSNYVLDTEDA